MKFPLLYGVSFLFFYIVVSEDPPTDHQSADDTVVESTTMYIPTVPEPADDTMVESTTFSIPTEPASVDGITTDSTIIDNPDKIPVDDTSTEATTESTTMVETTTVVDGSWGGYTSWTSCSVACGTGNKYRTRSCDNPAPNNNGNDCDGSNEDATSCSAGECCAPKVFDLVYLIDITESYFDYVKTFYTTITDIFTISPSATRVSIVTSASAQEIKVAFNNYTDIISAINGLSKQWGSPNPKAALEFVRSDVLTEKNGARSDISDVVIMTSAKSSYRYAYRNSEDDDPKPAANKLKENGVYLIIGEGRRQTEFQDIADVYKGYSYMYSSYETFGDDVAAGFPCNYFCGTSVFALDSPANLASGNDSSAGYMYLMTNTTYQMTCCGATSTWEFFAVNQGIVEVMIFRNTGLNRYYLVGSTRIVVPEEYIGTTVSFSLIASERVAIVEGDYLGWHSTGPNIIGHADCTIATRPDCPVGNKMLKISRDTFEDGETIDFTNAIDVPNRGYSLKLATTNNTELTITAIQNETEIEENTPIGFKVMYFRVTDTDLGDNFTMTLTGDSSLFAISDVQYEQVELTLQHKLPSGANGPYIITITGTDSCQHTASTTVTVSTYNAPPVVNNLPQIMEMSDTIKEPIFLYSINVTDVTNDPICCTLSHTLPVSYNFQFKHENGVYSIWTSNNPAFSYGDIDAYRIFICCQDPYGSTTSYLIIRLTEVKEDSTYIPPGWFTRAIAVSMLPVSIMTILTFVTLIITMFCLDPPQHVEEDTEEESEGRESKAYKNATSSPDSGTGTDMEESCVIEEQETEVKAKSQGQTIYFKNLYTDEEVFIPVWKSRKGNTVSDQQRVVTQPKRHEAAARVINETSEHDDFRPRSLRSKSRTEFGVEMKLFNYGRKTQLTKPDEERAIEIFQKKNDIREKWQETIAKAAMLKKQKELRSKARKSNTDQTVDYIEKSENNYCQSFHTSNGSDSSKAKIPVKSVMESDKVEQTIGMKEESFFSLPSDKTLSVCNLSISEKDDNSIHSVIAEDVVEGIGESEDDILSVFNTMVETGVAAPETHLNVNLK